MTSPTISPHERIFRRLEQQVSVRWRWRWLILIVVGSEKRISPGEYRVSVLAMNNHSQSEAVAMADYGGRYTIGSLTAPDLETIKVELQVNPAKHLVAHISWLCDLDSPEGGFNVKVTKPNQETADGYPR